MELLQHIHCLNLRFLCNDINILDFLYIILSFIYSIFIVDFILIGIKLEINKYNLDIMSIECITCMNTDNGISIS